MLTNHFSVSGVLPGLRLQSVRNGGALVILSLMGVLGCRPATPSAIADSAGTVIPVEDTLLVDRNPIRGAFLARYAGLERMGKGWGLLLFPKGRARSIDMLRSELPEGHPLRYLEGLDMEDRVYAIIAMPGADSIYVIHSDGPSGDPSFYLADGRTGATTDYIWGEILALPDSGPMMMYQRVNAYFPTVKEVRYQGGRFEEVPSSRLTIGLRSIALDTITLSRSPSDSTQLGTLQPGDSLIVVEAASPDGPLLVQTPSGLRGWTSRMGGQCNSMSIRGICGYGD